MATFAINPTGLRIKPTYESQVNYIANQPRFAYPDRNATMAARSPKWHSYLMKTPHRWQSNKQEHNKIR